MTEGRFGVTQTCVNGTVPAVTHICKQMSRRRVRHPRRTVLCFRLCKRDVEDAVPYKHNLKHPINYNLILYANNYHAVGEGFHPLPSLCRRGMLPDKLQFKPTQKHHPFGWCLESMACCYLQHQFSYTFILN